MAASRINVGFIDKRCSSRILKPPGGGYSDIFGTDTKPEVEPSKTKAQAAPQQPTSGDAHLNGKNQSGDAELTGAEAEKQPEKTAAEEEGDKKPAEEANVDEAKDKLGELEIKDETDGLTKTPEAVVSSNPNTPKKDTLKDIIDESSVFPSENVAPSPRKTTPSRGRVPPGGYSSGLW